MYVKGEVWQEGAGREWGEEAAARGQRGQRSAAGAARSLRGPRGGQAAPVEAAHALQQGRVEGAHLRVGRRQPRRVAGDGPHPERLPPAARHQERACEGGGGRGWPG